MKEATRLEMGETTKVTDHLVQFGCSYTVSIQSSPLDINSVRTKLTTTFTVPGKQDDDLKNNIVID